MVPRGTHDSVTPIAYISNLTTHSRNATPVTRSLLVSTVPPAVFTLIIWCEVVSAHADADVIGAALGAIVLVGTSEADAEAVAGELDPGVGQGGHASPGDGRVLEPNLIGKRSS